MDENININAAGENPALSDREVTSHTASMWKYNPIPESPEPYPEYKNSIDITEKSSVIAARVRGKKHKHKGTNCDDWYEFKRCGDCIIAAVSDGAGSKPLSRIGAKVSCEAAVAMLKQEFTAVMENCPDYKNILSKPFNDPDFTSLCSKLAVIMQNSCCAAFSAVEGAYISRLNREGFEESLGRKPDIKDYSCTLLTAVIIPAAGGEHFVIAIQIGDGMIASVNAYAQYGDALRILGNADSGSFAGETEFLTSEQTRTPDSLRSRTKIQRGKISSLMLMTDGVADDYYPNDPQLLRLYMDLMLNGAIDIPSDDELTAKFGSGYIDKEKYKTAEPVSYPWVNDGDVSYTLQYAKNVMAENEMELSALWNDKFKGVISASSLKALEINNGADNSERLSVWLDNYNERGSFDDRTLLIINV
ncbi:MAG: PP2C family serine/threonine-protein phosphatase [Huintestinicola sp.]